MFFIWPIHMSLNKCVCTIINIKHTQYNRNMKQGTTRSHRSHPVFKHYLLPALTEATLCSVKYAF